MYVMYIYIYTHVYSCILMYTWDKYNWIPYPDLRSFSSNEVWSSLLWILFLHSLHLKVHSLKLGIKHGIKCFFLPPQKTLLIRHVVTKHRSDLHLSSNLQVRSNVILSRVGAILLVSCTLQTRALCLHSLFSQEKNYSRKKKIHYFGVENFLPNNF